MMLIRWRRVRWVLAALAGAALLAVLVTAAAANEHLVGCKAYGPGIHQQAELCRIP